MPSKQPPAQNPDSTRPRPREQRRHPSRGGVKMLLGLPFSDSGVPSAVALTVPLGRHRYGQWPLQAPEERDGSCAETASDDGVMQQVGAAVADFPELPERSLAYETDIPRDFPRASLRDGALFSGAIRENAADARAKVTQPSAEHREQTRLVIPGVSIHRTAFPTLSQTVDTQTNNVEEELRDAIPPQAAPLNVVSLPRAREMTTSNGELLTRLEQLVTEGVQTQKSSEARTRLSAPRAPGLPEPMGMESGERRGQDLAHRVENLQRTVRDLAATVSSQVARNRNESQAQPRERKTAPPQRTVIIKRSEASSTTPRAFWERSRLGRFYLRTVR